MKNYTPIEPIIVADQITAVSIVTTATFADGTTALVQNGAVEGDYMIQKASGNTVLSKADFEAEYTPAP